MSHTSKIFEEVPVKVQNKNGFDLSHLNCGTSKCGQLVPVMCKLLPPNSDFTLGINMNVELPPLATSFMGRIDAIVEGFVVPCSMLYGGWKQFISNQQPTMFPNKLSAVESAGGFALPYFLLEKVRGNAQNPEIASFTTLLNANNNIVEYLGFRPHSVASGTAGPKINLLPLLAYHLIWDVYYRNKQITKTIFSVNPNTIYDPNADEFNNRNVSLIWHSFYSSYTPSGDNPYDPDFSKEAYQSGTLSDGLTFPDGVSVFSTRQRNYSRDYFTAGTPSPQQGNASKLVFDTSGANGEFTINALRAANSLQKFLETNNLSGDYADMMRNRWGTRPIDADFDEPYYLGRVVLPVYQKSVYQNQNANVTSDHPSPNPFVSSGALGGRGAHGGFAGEGSICDKFHNSTWSYVMCLFSLVPHAMYAYGLNRELNMLEIGDFPAPELQSIGNEAILTNEVYYDPANALDKVFAYIPRYSRFKYMDDEIHGELRPGRTLDSFVLQRVFPTQQYTPSLNTAFLEISQDALDDVFAVSTESMNLSCWYEIFFEFKVSMPLADFCIPTLGDIQDTHTIKSKQGGSRL